MGGKGSGQWTRNQDENANKRSIALTRRVMRLQKPDYGSAESMDAQFEAYLDLCDEHEVRPLIGSLALAFKLDKRRMWEFLNSPKQAFELGFNAETLRQFQNFYSIVEANFEQALVESRNPVPAIYYSKAQLGWRETPTETVVTHRREESPQLSGGTADEIAAKYAQIVGVEDVGAGELPEGS